ncbi:hypothetical protein T4E_2026 [Trichinella pseudospiralis]|uniref:Uncharacterized protein n=1 Tax=Trichinella pseudospiralis TaxID=6337 RepID=A0A0V0YA56_TRIPS|nr:hypothetical protein T4E_2026 [Trichinella pseudospiralis]
MTQAAGQRAFSEACRKRTVHLLYCVSKLANCGAQGPKSVGQKYNRLFWPSSSSRRSAFAIVLSTLARVKLAVLVGVQCKEFLPKKEHVPQILPLGLIDNRRPASFFLH